MRGLVFLLTLVCIATAQHQVLIDYLERRLLAIEDRISLWQEQTTRYASELRELKQQMVSQLESLDKEKETIRMTLDGVGTRVDRVERELDYLETQNGAQPCVDVDDRLIEQQVTLVKEKQKAKYFKLTGEMFC
ncbi:Olfactomedin-like protein 3A [Ilyodon furcidens]|uniref:Olfactomedin-like protein 3A n=1 Tax=Ilyodon furcidens TaxID=33524 RepID=A0ABV0T7E5_9TELE